MKKVTFTPKTDIEEYIQEGFSIKIINEFYESGKAGNYNLNIYEELTEGIGWENWQGLFDPLEFLNLFYEQLTIVEANKEKPIQIIKHLLGLKLEKKQLRYLLFNLKDTIPLYYFVVSSSEVDQLNICYRFINREYDKLSLELDLKYTPDVMYMPEPHPESEPQPIKYKAQPIVKQKTEQGQPETLSSIITHEKAETLVSGIKTQYKNIKGKRLKLLLIALQELELLPKERIAQKFHTLCNNEFDWEIASYNAMNGYNFNSHTDTDEVEGMKQYIKTLLSTK